MKRELFIFSFLALFLLGACAEQNSDTKEYHKSSAASLKPDFKPAETEEAVPDSVPEIVRPKNIIFMVGDGMGVAQVYAGFTQNKGQLNLEQFKCIGFSKTYSSSDYVTDSAAGATAFSIGKKTYNGAIGVDADTVPHETILESAEKHGLATGLVATCRITHATPAAFIAHQSSRKMYEEIASDFLKTDVDVFIGGGYNDFAKRSDNTNLVDSLKNNGYQFAATIDEVKSAKNEKLAALLYPEHPPTYSDGRGDMLGVAAGKALEIVSQNENGFFMLIEGSQIDWGGHANDGDYIANEMVDFDNVVGQMLDWARKDGETLIVITADHETGGFAIPGGNLKEGTFEAGFATKHHSGVMVPVFAYGPGAEAFMGIYQNTAFYDKFKAAFGF